MEFDINDIIEQQGQVSAPPQTQEEYAEQKRVEKAMCQQMRSLALTHAFSGRDAFMQYLDMQAVLTNMSAGNTLLILSQNPNAKDVRSFDAWKAASRSIKTGETGLLIFEASPYETQDDGKIVQRTGYNVRRRFDVAQTHGLPLTPPQDVPFDPVRRIHALVANPPVRLVESDSAMEHAARYDAQERVIFVSKGYDAVQTFRAMTVAIAEASVNPGARHPGTTLAAQSAAYIACTRVGMMGHPYSVDFQFEPTLIPPDDRMNTLNDAVSMAAALHSRMERKIEPREHMPRAAGGR